jgi:hypothetical protein
MLVSIQVDLATGCDIWADCAVCMTLSLCSLADVHGGGGRAGHLRAAPGQEQDVIVWHND